MLANDVAPTAGIRRVALTNTSAGDPLQAVLVSRPSHGSLTLNSNGSFAYTPAYRFTGWDSFTYRARDAVTGTASNVATVRIRVTFGLGRLLPTSWSKYRARGSMRIQFQLQTGSGAPISDVTARGISKTCGATIAFAAMRLAHPCVTYDATGRVFSRTIVLPRKLPKGTNVLVVSLRVARGFVAVVTVRFRIV